MKKSVHVKSWLGQPKIQPRTFCCGLMGKHFGRFSLFALITILIACLLPLEFGIKTFYLGTLSKRKNDIIWEIFPTWGGVFPNPKTFVNLPSIFLYAKLGPKWPQMVKNMLYWSSGIILGPLRPLWDIGKLAMFGHFWPQKGHYDKGFPKGGGGGGGPTFGKNSQIISFFLFDSVPHAKIGKYLLPIRLLVCSVRKF